MAIRRKVRKAGKTLRRALPWWLGGGGDRCEGCGHHHTASARCAACDRSFCPLCLELEGGEAFCAECHEGGGGSWQRARSGKA